jgi:hypothetical protein
MMGGRGGGSAVSRNRMQADFEALRREQSQLGPEQQVQRAINDQLAAYTAFVPSGGGWVDLADLRERMPGMSREQFDRLVLDMGIGPNRVLDLTPEVKQSTLTPRRRAGGISVGGEVNHLVRIRRR